MEIIFSKIRILKNKLTTVVFFSLCYAAGIFIGLIFKENCFNPSLYNSAATYYTCIFDVYTSVFSILMKRISAALFMFAVVFILSLNKISAYFAAFIIFLRGLILGMVLNVFWSSYFVSGVFIFIFVVLIQNVIITAGMIFALILNLHIYDKPFACKRNELLINFGLCFGVCFIGALYEFLILTFVVRPIILWF